MDVDKANPSFCSDDRGALFDKERRTLLQAPDVSDYTIPEGVTTIGQGAFSECSNLTSVTIPSSVTSIGNYAFAYSGLTSVAIPPSVTEIGEMAFGDCTNLTSVTIPPSVKIIKKGAFSKCPCEELVTEQFRMNRK